LIGKNGTGKSTILNLLNSILQNKDLLGLSNVILRFRIDGEDFYVFQTETQGLHQEEFHFISADLDKELEWVNDLRSSKQPQSVSSMRRIGYRLRSLKFLEQR
jgi:ABC-type cobalamin/Fe3+-siderophores transport system ATPase subunit